MKIREKIRRLIIEVKRDQRGEGYIDVLVKILISVIIGSLLLGLMKVAIPDIFSGIVSNVKSFLSI